MRIPPPCAWMTFPFVSVQVAPGTITAAETKEEANPRVNTANEPSIVSREGDAGP